MLKGCLPAVWNRALSSSRAAVGLFVAAAGLVGAARADLILDTPIVAHRGFSYIAPQNSLAAIDEAIKVGASGSEFDVRKCASGELVLMHNTTVTETTNGETLGLPSTYISSLTWAQLQQCVIDYNPPSPVDAIYDTQRIPSMAQAMAKLKNSGTKAICEIKASGIGAAVVSQIVAAGMLDQTVVISFIESHLAEVHAANPNIVTGLLFFDDDVWGGTSRNPLETDVDLANRVCGLMDSCNADFANIEHSALTPALVAELKSRGVASWACTVDDPVRMQQLLDMGVVGITTNRPDLGLELVPEPSCLAMLAGLSILLLGRVWRRR